MASVKAKRKATDHGTEPEKRQRIEAVIPPTNDQCKIDDQEDADSDANNSSDEENTVDTPATPFSPVPGRKKFPSELKVINCTYEGCLKTFNRPARLTAHLRTHNNDRAFKCTYEGCDKAYFQDKHLQAHVKGSHTHDRAYVCDWEGCEKSFLTSTRLNRHKGIHVGQERFRCTAYPPCNQTFRKHQTLQRHINSEHLQLAPYQCTYVDPITKVACTAGFDGGNGLRQHVERVHGNPRFFCPDCVVLGHFDLSGGPIHVGFVTEKDFQAHIRKEHANCPFCDLKCKGQRELQKHVESQHSGTTLQDRKTIPCTYAGCDRKFTKKNNLTSHIRSIHMGERFICGSYDVSSYPDVAQFDDSDGCGKDFVSKQYLVDHVRTAHLGLPTVLNAKRRTVSAAPDMETDDDDEYMDDDFIDDEDDMYSEKPSKRKGRKTKSSLIADLVGKSYAKDPKRKIPCSVATCQRRFMRDYDLQVHLNTSHQENTPDTLPPSSSTLLFNQPGPFQYAESSTGAFGTISAPNSGISTPSLGNYVAMEGAMDMELDWELQRQALEGGTFWVGADNLPFASGEDQEWDREAKEMRRLIG